MRFAVALMLLMPPLMAAAPAAKPDDIVARWDTDGDGRLSAIEWRRAVATLARPRQLTAKEWVTLQVSYEEFFEQADVDANGFVTKAEMQKFEGEASIRNETELAANGKR